MVEALGGVWRRGRRAAEWTSAYCRRWAVRTWAVRRQGWSRGFEGKGGCEGTRVMRGG